MGTTLKVKRVNHDAPTPRYQHDGDAGLDLSSMETVWVYPGRTEMVRTGIAIELSEAMWGSCSREADSAPRDSRSPTACA